MENFKPEQTVARLVEALPNFTECIDLEEGPYIVLGEFAILLRDGIDSGELSAKQQKEVFDFLNIFGMSDNPEIQNQLVVGIFEILADTQKTAAVCRTRLSGPSLVLFERALAGWSIA